MSSFGCLEIRESGGWMSSFCISFCGLAILLKKKKTKKTRSWNWEALIVDDVSCIAVAFKFRVYVYLLIEPCVILLDMLLTRCKARRHWYSTWYFLHKNRSQQGIIMYDCKFGIFGNGKVNLLLFKMLLYIFLITSSLLQVFTSLIAYHIA